MFIFHRNPPITQLRVVTNMSCSLQNGRSTSQLQPLEVAHSHSLAWPMFPIAHGLLDKLEVGQAVFISFSLQHSLGPSALLMSGSLPCKLQNRKHCKSQRSLPLLSACPLLTWNLLLHQQEEPSSGSEWFSFPSSSIPEVGRGTCDQWAHCMCVPQIGDVWRKMSTHMPFLWSLGSFWAGLCTKNSTGFCIISPGKWAKLKVQWSDHIWETKGALWNRKLEDRTNAADGWEGKTYRQF